MREKMRPRASQRTALEKRRSNGQRHEASMAGTARRASRPGAGTSAGDGESAVIDGYSYLFGGGGAGGGLAASARAVRLLRAAAGFLYSSRVNSMARSIFRRTNPLV